MSAPETATPLPVSQKPEILFYSASTALFASAEAVQLVEIVSEFPPSIQNIGLAAEILAGTGFAAYQAQRARKETRAYEQATREERESPKALERLRFVRSMRTLAWGGSVLISTEATTLGILNLAGHGHHKVSEAVVIGMTAIGGTGMAASVPNTIKSWRKGRKLKQRLQESD